MSARGPVCTPLPVVTLPFPGECLGSWIARVATWYSIPVRTFLAHLGIVRVGSAKNWLILGQLNASEIMILAKSLRRATKTLTAMASSPWTLPAHSEFGMCVFCVMDAVAAGKPMYWRSAWLDSVTVGCLQHAAWLTPVDESVFLQSVNWHGVDKVLVGIAKNRAIGSSGRAPSSVPQRADISALNLQSVFYDSTTEGTAQTRYRTSSSRDARLIAIDLLDVLLAANSDTAGSRSSALSELATFLRMPLTSDDVTIGPRLARSMCIRRVKMLDARVFAMAIVDTLMYASARINEPLLQPCLSDARSLRTHWLWPLMPKSSVDLLIQRMKNWPPKYVDECWPELKNAEEIHVLQRTSYLISQCANREKLHLANVH